MKRKLFLSLLFAVLAIGVTSCQTKPNTPEKTGTVTESAAEDGSKTYTYNGSFALSPSTFDPLNYKSTTDAVPLDYTTNSLYEYAYNADGTGFELVPVMAAADPVDVTATYAVDNKYGIEGKTSGYAYRIALNQDAKWDNGEAITADDYIYTMQQLLDPTVSKYRASNYYSGTTVIANAKGYFYSGRKGTGNASLAYPTWAEAVEAADKITFVWEDDYNNVYSYLCSKGYDAYIGTAKYPTMTALCAALGLSGVTDEQVQALVGKTYAEIKADATMKATLDTLAAWWNDTEDDTLGFFKADYSLPVVDWDSVGLKKIDNYTVDIIYTGEIQGFYKKYSISLPLVYKKLYESCKRQDATTGAWSTDYGTSVETYMGYGPYKLTKYVTDQVMEFEKSSTWFGYTAKYADTYGSFTAEFDGKTHKQYQTTKVVLSYVKEISTREEMFNLGQLEVFGMNKEYYDKYKNSDRLYNSTGASTYYGVVLSDYSKLVEREATLNGTTYSASYNGATQQYNKTILTIKEFRQALCYALDRKALCTALYPGGSPAISLFSDLIVADPDNGLKLNDFNEIKAAICSFWGVEYGADKEFKTLDKAYASITGYDLTTAKQLVTTAYNKALEEGLLGETTTVRFEYCASADSETEQKWYQFFKTCFEDLCKGTPLEGRIQIDYNTNLGSDFGAAIQSGKADTAWGFGWSGGELDPYSLIEVYVDAAMGKEDDPYQYDSWINRDDKANKIKVTVDGKDYEYTALEWFYVLNGDEHAPEVDGKPLDWSYLKVDNKVRAAVLAAVEESVLNDYTTIPMMNSGSVQLLSYKVNYGKESYMFGMGFGGIRYMTYNFDDAAWTAYINSQPNKTLKYN